MNNERGEILTTVLIVLAILGALSVLSNDHKNKSHSEAPTQQEQTETAKK